MIKVKLPVEKHVYNWAAIHFGTDPIVVRRNTRFWGAVCSAFFEQGTLKTASTPSQNHSYFITLDIIFMNNAALLHPRAIEAFANALAAIVDVHLVGFCDGYTEIHISRSEAVRRYSRKYQANNECHTIHAILKEVSRWSDMTARMERTPPKNKGAGKAMVIGYEGLEPIII